MRPLKVGLSLRLASHTSPEPQDSQVHHYVWHHGCRRGYPVVSEPKICVKDDKKVSTHKSCWSSTSASLEKTAGDPEVPCQQ